MRVPLAVIALLLASLPLVAANQAPVPSASYPPTARLHEPVTFTSTSVDPDGVIVSTSWEDSNGREKSGTSVTMVFAFAGIHTLLLRVTDNEGATSSKELQIEVLPTLMHGRAYALRAGDARLADTGDVVTPYHTDHEDPVGAVSYGALRVAGLDATLRTLNDRAVARADVGYVHIPHPLGYFLVTGVEAESIVGCDDPTLVNTKFTQVRFNDAALVPPGEVAPNTRVEVPGVGSLELNVLETTGDGRIATTAVRFTSAAGVVEIAHAEAGVSNCPYR